MFELALVLIQYCLVKASSVPFLFFRLFAIDLYGLIKP